MQQKMGLPTQLSLDPTHFLTGYLKAQLAEKSSDVILILHERNFYSFGNEMMRNHDFGYKLRLSKKPIESFAYGRQQPIFWMNFGQMLSEKLSHAIDVIKVCGPKSCL